MEWLFYEIREIPDLSLVKYQMLGESGVEGVLEKHVAFLRQWQRLSIICKVGVHLYIIYDFEAREQERIKVCIGFSFKNAFYKEKLKQIMSASPLRAYYNFVESASIYNQLDNYSFSAKSIVKKTEREKTTEDVAHLKLYTVEGWEANENARLIDMIRCMSSLRETAVYCVTFYGRQIYREASQALEKPISFLRRKIFDKGESLNLKNDRVTPPRDSASEETLKVYEDFLTTVVKSPCFQANIKVYSNDSLTAQILLNAACGEAIEKGECQNVVLPIGKYSVLEPEWEAYTEVVPDRLKFWPTMFSLEEIAPFIRFPVMYDGEYIELKKETMPDLDDHGIYIGETAQKYKTYITLNNLMKHAFVCGVPGSGKTNTMLRIADCLWNNQEKKFNEYIKRPVPFLVLEPAKREYRELAMFDIENLIIFSPNANTRFPLQLNPFEFPKGLTLSEHITRLRQVFEGAFPMQAPAPFILDQSMEAVYYKYGWNASDINVGGKEYPTMSELYAEFEQQLLKTNYDGEIQGNIRSVLEMRIGSLIRREKKDMFDVEKSIIAPEEWLKYPIVIELEALGKETANFVTLLLCTIIRETLKVNPMEGIESKRVEGQNGNEIRSVYKPLRHVIFIEEAHNLIASQSQMESNQESNPKIAATECLVDMLKEVRALREGMIIADQLPTAMAMDVIKNTNIKIVHRLTSGDDRGLVGNTMAASELQLEQVATYMPGQTLMMYEGLLKPFEMQVCNLENHGNETPNDDQLYEIMKEKRGQQEIYRRLESRKWLKLQKKIEVALILENSHRKALRGYNFENKSLQQIEDFFNQCFVKYQALTLMRQTYECEFEKMSAEYIEDKVLDGTKEILNKLGECYGSEIQFCIKKYM